MNSSTNLAQEEDDHTALSESHDPPNFTAKADVNETNRAIRSTARKSICRRNGYLLFELGINESLEVAQIMKNTGFKNIQIVKDLANIDRVILGQI